MPTEAPPAFFSYSRTDSEFALKLAADLKKAGANAWLDQLDIEPGAPWDRAVEDALTQSPRVLLILSPNSVASDNIRDEVSFALNEQKRIIPVLYRDCKVPFRLARLQHIDFRTDYEHGLETLLRALRIEEPVMTHAGAAPASEAVKSGSSLEDLGEGSTGYFTAEQERIKAVLEKARQQRLEEEQRAAAELERLEEQRKLAAERKALRQRQEREAAEEKARQEKAEEEKQAAAERARLEKERRLTEEQALVEEQERRRKAALEELARREELERQQKMAEQARLEEERKLAAEEARKAEEERQRIAEGGAARLRAPERLAAQKKAHKEELERARQEAAERYQLERQARFEAERKAAEAERAKQAKQQRQARAVNALEELAGRKELERQRKAAEQARIEEERRVAAEKANRQEKELEAKAAREKLPGSSGGRDLHNPTRTALKAAVACGLCWGITGFLGSGTYRILARDFYLYRSAIWMLALALLCFGTLATAIGAKLTRRWSGWREAMVLGSIWGAGTAAARVLNHAMGTSDIRSDLIFALVGAIVGGITYRFIANVISPSDSGIARILIPTVSCITWLLMSSLVNRGFFHWGFSWNSILYLSLPNGVSCSPVFWFLTRSACVPESRG